MAKRLLLVVTSVLISGALALASTQNPSNSSSNKVQNPCNPCAKKAQNPCNPCSGKAVKSGKQTITGYIGDNQCGLDHAMGGDAKACTLKCVDGGGKFILADRDNKIVYSLDQKGQGKAREYAGQKVKVSGSLDAKTKTIRVTSIEAAS